MPIGMLRTLVGTTIARSNTPTLERSPRLHGGVLTEDDWLQRRLLPQGVRLHERVGRERERTARRAVEHCDGYESDVP